jgi:RNA polymerase sigma-70 factor (ECF subfamily)
MLRLLRPPEPTPAGRPLGGQGLGERPQDSLRHLAAAAVAGNVDAERTLLVTMGPAMLKVVRGVLGSAAPDVEDALQESMVAVHLALPGFRGECTTLHFACRIAVQTAMNARRRAGYRSKHTPNTAPSELAELASLELSPADLVAAERRREALRLLLLELPEPQAEVLALHVLLGYTVEEVAAATAVPTNTVRSRLRNALAKLRVRVQSDGALLEAIRGGA